MSRFALPLLALLCLVLQAPTLAAEEGGDYDAKTDRLRGLTRADLKLLLPHLQRGPVALVEFADTEGDQLPAINLAAVVHAPPAELLKLIRDPKRYPRFMRTLDSVEVHSEQRDTVLYDWRWQMGLLELEGRNAMRIYEPPPERASRGYRVTIDSQHGDLGSGRMSLRVLPHAGGSSLLVVSVRLDLRKANYVARRIAKAARSINRSANMSLAYSMLLSLRREAETRAGYTPPAPPPGTLEKPPVDERAIFPMLQRGDLVLHEMRGDRLDQIAIFGLIYRSPTLVREVMLDANAFGSALMPGSDAKVVSQQGPVTTFDWDIDLPLVGVSGQMRMRDDNPLVSIDATEGALSGGRWVFHTRPLGKQQQATLMSGWARFDLRKSSWLLRNLVDADPYLGHGMTAASEVMLLRALRSRSRKKAEELAALAAKRSDD